MHIRRGAEQTYLDEDEHQNKDEAGSESGYSFDESSSEESNEDWDDTVAHPLRKTHRKHRREEGATQASILFQPEIESDEQEISQKKQDYHDHAK